MPQAAPSISTGASPAQKVDTMAVEAAGKMVANAKDSVVEESRPRAVTACAKDK